MAAHLNSNDIQWEKLRYRFSKTVGQAHTTTYHIYTIHLQPFNGNIY